MRGRKKKELPAYLRGRLSLDEMLASRRVLQLVHERGPLTQGEASEALGLSQGSCNLHFQRLEYDGLFRALLHLLPEGRVFPGHRPHGGNADLRHRGRGGECKKCGGTQ